MSSVELACEQLMTFIKRLPAGTVFQKTASPNILITKLPSHWRSNKSLPCPFVVLLLAPVPDGTKVSVSAGNEENASADIKNNVAEVCEQVARFSDLRFVGKSGRGKNFNLTITVQHSSYHEIAVASSVIKVTVDGPRETRNANKYFANVGFEFRKRPASHMDLAPFGYPSTSFDMAAKRARPDLPSSSANGMDMSLLKAMNAVSTPAVMPPIFPVMRQPLLSQLYQTYLLCLSMAQVNAANGPVSEVSSDEPRKPTENEEGKSIKSEVWRPFS